jgi:deoxyhypusine synthase
MNATSKSKKNMRNPDEYGDGYSDNLEPLSALDLSKVESVNDLVSSMSNTAFGGRRVGEAADVLEMMAKDKECYKVLTLSGAMTIAKMGLVICDMIDNGLVDAVVSTGALITHGFVESTGMTHFKHRKDMKDEELYKKGYNRVYDTLELEKNLDDTEKIVESVLKSWPQDQEICSYVLNELLGEYLVKNTDGRGILKSAFEKEVPVYIPAFTDSEMALDFGIYRRKKKMKGEEPAKFNPFLDLEDYTERISKAKKIGIFTVGGGVPRNWAQQVGPYLDIINSRIGKGGAFRRFHYAVRICPEPATLGGLSGCTYSEGVSWGKFVPESEGGKQVEVYADATIAWPMIVKAVLERMEKKR